MKIILNIYSNESKEVLISYQNSLYFITIVVKILRTIEEEEPTMLLTPNFKIIFFLINDMFYNHQSSDILHSSNDIILLFNSLNQYYFLFEQNIEHFFSEELEESIKKGKMLSNKITNNITSEVNSFYKEFMERNKFTSKGGLYSVGTMNISDFPQPDSIFEDYENVFKKMKVQDLITLHNDFQDKKR